MVQTIGSAVYKARTLYTILNPMVQYNDRLMCIQGQNKNGNSGFLNLDSLYEAQTNEYANSLANQQSMHNSEVNNSSIKINGSNFEDILLYPNPAEGFVNVNYFKEDGIFELYDALGKLILNEKLFVINGTHKIILPKLSNGVYNYRMVFSKENYTGKLNIIQNE